MLTLGRAPEEEPEIRGQVNYPKVTHWGELGGLFLATL
jgi:hypothetical protein